MRGKVKYVRRAVWYEHIKRFTNTYAVLYNGDEVNIDEDDIRDYYDHSNITQTLINELSDDLHNEWIEYSEDWDGDYWLNGDLEDYI